MENYLGASDDGPSDAYERVGPVQRHIIFDYFSFILSLEEVV
jgi:hypothetical protein